MNGGEYDDPVVLSNININIVIDLHLVDVVAGKQHVVQMDVITRYRKEENIKDEGGNNM